MTFQYYGMDGEPIDLDEWSALREGDGRRVAETHLPGGVWVSTVLLGMDHNFGSGPPLIFETMVFGPDDMSDLDMDRYPTKEQALAGHEAIVTKWTGWIPGTPEPDQS